jgi:hypothetical protein
MSQRPAALPVGSLVDGLQVERLLGQGNNSASYLVTDPQLGTRFVLREYLPAGLVTRDAELGDIFAHLLVTVHTQFILRLLVEFLVAKLTLLFFLGVPLDDITWHQQLVGVRLHGQREQEEDEG